MKFSSLTLIGLINLSCGELRNLKERTRKPRRVKRVELISNLESLVASLQANITTLSAQSAAAAMTIAELQANVTQSMSQIVALTSQVNLCQTKLNSSFNGTQVNTTVYKQLVSEYAFDIYDQVTPSQYKTIARLSNNNNAKNYEIAGDLTYNSYNPEPGFYLSNAGDDTLVRDMQVSCLHFYLSVYFMLSHTFVFESRFLGRVKYSSFLKLGISLKMSASVFPRPLRIRNLQIYISSPF
jgi:uncharacterized coiled-coil protein SlyX